MAKNHHSWGSVRKVATKSTPKTSGLYEFNVFDHMNAKVDAIYQNIDTLRITPYTPVTHTPITFVPPLLSVVRYAELMGIPIEIAT